MERIAVLASEDPVGWRLLRSPAFVRGIARDDVVAAMEQPEGAFQVRQHGGNLCVRVLSRSDNDALAQILTGEIEKLGGTLDVAQPRVLVYSIHVSCGFQVIEELLNRHVAEADGHAWLYGNVYDPATQEPLNWWLPILAPQ